jgi:hypothetical protein
MVVCCACALENEIKTGSGGDTQPSKPSGMAKRLLPNEPVAVVAKTDSGVVDAGGVNRVEEDPIIRQLRLDKIVGVRPLASRTLSVRIKLESGGKAVFKPFCKGDKRARREVVAFILATHMGVGLVPRAVVRSVRLEMLALRLETQNLELATLLRDNAYVDEKGYVKGAIIEWVDDLDSAGLDSFGGTRGLKKMIVSEESPDFDHPLARSASRMAVFDYLIGNWDRFSGGNVFAARDGRSLVLIDHNGAFGAWSNRQNKKMSRLLEQTSHFSMDLIQRIRKFNSGDLSRVLAAETEYSAQRLLTSKEVELLFLRREAILSHVDRLASDGSKNKRLFFP